VRRAGGSGQQISELSIHNSAGFARIRAEADSPENLYWQLVKTKEGHAEPACSTELSVLSNYAKTIQERISGSQEKCNLPIFIYYPVNRNVINVSLRRRRLDEFNLLSAWDNSLVGSVDFERFFEWFRSRDNLEDGTRRDLMLYLMGRATKNKKYLPRAEYGQIEKEVLSEGADIKSIVSNYTQDSHLLSVRNAIQSFLPEFKSLSIRLLPSEMWVEKYGVEIRFDQLSDGEKCLIALIGDLARRLAIANPNRENPLEGEGIVLIDEIDLHIHPAWQRTILANLTRTFPNCQFVVSTHSPQVLGEAEPRQIRLLTQDEDGLTYSIPTQAKGLSSNEILDELMRPDGETLTRNRGVQEQLDKLFELIDRDDFQAAKGLVGKMKHELHGDIPELIRAESMIFMLDEGSDS
ncbi:AAA family ATPase, partial [Methylomagnum sp.]